MEDGIVLHYPDGSCFLGCVKINDTEMFFFKKSGKGIYNRISIVSGGIASGVYNSLIPNALASEEKKNGIQIDEIVEAKRKRFRLNKNAYYVTLKDGNTYIMIFDNPNSTIEYLESVISKAK
jgi:hypothetical protein